jgi:hypothetical protein
MKFYLPKDGLKQFIRRTKSTLVPTSSIQVEDFVQDKHFLELYISWMQGNVDGWVTRAQIDNIVLGHFYRSSDGSIRHIEPSPSPKPEYVNAIANQIRNGSRPRAVLYPGYLPGTQDKLISCDDVNTCMAYSQLGITSLPVLILGRPDKKLLNESAIILRIRNDASISRFSTYAHEPKIYHSTIGEENRISGINPIKAIGILKSELEKALNSIKEFHNRSQGSSPMHYHHTLYSSTLRTLEAIRAVELLIEKGLYRQIRSVIRSTYEVFLNFYIDWLDPESVGPILQIVSEMSRIDDKAALKELRVAAETQFGGLVGLCETVSQKGRLSPLGEIFHNGFYANLSPLVHQDFGATIEYGQSLETGEVPKEDLEEVMSLIRSVDLIVTALVLRVLNDVGKAELTYK